MSATPLAVGSTVDELYELTAVIGRGGMATVYECRERQTGAELAIKVLGVPEDGDMESRRMFFNELLLATRVEHDHFVRVHDFGVMRSTGAPYLVMERLHGHTLSRELRLRGGMAPARAVALFEGPLSALAAAHDKGVVHKDLKPPNLFLCSPGTPEEHIKVLDFGVASKQGIETSLSADPNRIGGTPSYMAPEYIRGQLVWPGLDVYQIGLVLVEAMTGRRVVADDDPMECLRQHERGELELPDFLRDGPLGPVLAKALARDPDERFADAGQLLQALRAIDAPLEAPAPAQAMEEPEDGASMSFSVDASTFSLSGARGLAGSVSPEEVPPAVEHERRDRAVAAMVGSAAALLFVVLGIWVILGGP